MIIRLTQLSFDKNPIMFRPFVMELPAREVGWDGGHDHVERLIEGECFPDEVINQIPNDYKEFTFDYDFEYSVTC